MMRNPTLNINTLCCAIVTRQIRKSLDGYFLSTPLITWVVWMVVMMTMMMTGTTESDKGVLPLHCPQFNFSFESWIPNKLLFFYTPFVLLLDIHITHGHGRGVHSNLWKSVKAFFLHHHQCFPKPKFNLEGLTGTSYGKDFTMLLLLTMQKLCWSRRVLSSALS